MLDIRKAIDRILGHIRYRFPRRNSTNIKDVLKDIPGELHEHPWVDFAHNRNKALELAKGKGDYILFIDADEVLSYEPQFCLPELLKDFYYIETHLNGMKYKCVKLVNNHINWRW